MLGLAEEEARDRLTYTYAAADKHYLEERFDPDRYKHGPGRLMLGEGYQYGRASAERTHFLSELEGMRKSMLREGRVRALGYCPVCKAVVELTKDLQCPNVPAEAEGRRERRAKPEHEKQPKRVLYVMPDQVEHGARQVLAKR